MSAPQQTPSPLIERPLPCGGILRIHAIEQITPSAEAAGQALWKWLLAEPEQTEKRDGAERR